MTDRQLHVHGGWLLLACEREISVVLLSVWFTRGEDGMRQLTSNPAALETNTLSLHQKHTKCSEVSNTYARTLQDFSPADGSRVTLSAFFITS